MNQFYSLSDDLKPGMKSSELCSQAFELEPELVPKFALAVDSKLKLVVMKKLDQRGQHFLAQKIHFAFWF